MNKIRHLNEHLTNMIAAGEVVERPSGIVKELVENSIDAKATEIEVILKDGGIASIQVIDNGTGMNSTDASMAFHRHATSKIFDVKDLWSISTLGFRGEALPSIAAVSNVVLLTNDGNEGSRIEVSHGQVVSAKPSAANQGTDITVEKLFVKTPARLKHLKSTAYETAIVTSIMEKFTLSYPHIAFKVILDNKEIFKTTGNGKLSDVVYAIYGKEVTKNSITLSANDFDYEISGLIVTPNISRANRNYITIFINGRMVRSTRLSKMVAEAYSPYLSSDRWPIAVIMIAMDPKLVDVNVHPSKWEIRLAKEKQLEQLLKQAILNTLKAAMSAPEIEISKPIIEDKVTLQSLDLQTVNTTEKIVAEESATYQVNTTPVEKETTSTTTAESTTSEIPKPNFPLMRVIGQMHGKYILAEDESTLYIIDQHAAQERYLYELYDQKMRATEVKYYDLLVPAMIEITSSQIQRIEEIKTIFANIGITIEQFGSNSIICRKVPLWMEKIEISDVLNEIVEYILEQQEVDFSKLRKKALISMACHYSVRFNRVLNYEESVQIVNDLKKCEFPFQCPHGRPTFIKLTDKQLLKEFRR